MFSIPSLVVTVLMTWAPFLVSNFPRIASVRAAFDRRRLLTVNPSCALFCDLLPSLGTGARPERLGQATIKIFALDQKLPAPMSHGGNPEPRMSALGQKQTSEHVRSMSALPPKADIGTKVRDVRFVPKADIGTLPSLNHRMRSVHDYE